MKGFQYFYGLLILVFVIGIVLRYGNSSHLLAGDLNSLIATITLQNNVPYHGPGQ